MTEDHSAELDEMVSTLESAGLLRQLIDEGKPALQLTPKGAQVARQMAMSSEQDAFAMFNAMLDAAAVASTGTREGPPLAGRASPSHECRDSKGGSLALPT